MFQVEPRIHEELVRHEMLTFLSLLAAADTTDGTCTNQVQPKSIAVDKFTW